MVDPNWLQRFLSSRSGRAVSLNIDLRKIDQSDPEVCGLLKEIGYSVEQTQVWSVCVTTTTPIEPEV